MESFFLFNLRDYTKLNPVQGERNWMEVDEVMWLAAPPDLHGLFF